MTTRFPITPEGYVQLNKELHTLKTIERPAVIAAITEARAHGDLSENAEYSAAKEKQRLLEAKIHELENKLGRAEVLSIKGIKVEQIQFGATVKLFDMEGKREVQYRITGDYEADIEKGDLSISSPLGKALLGKQSGDEVEVTAPKGIKYFRVISVEY